MKLLPFYIFIAIGVVLCFTSCKNSCDNITCPVGRICIDGNCECPSGFSGENCSKENSCITRNISCKNDGICIDAVCHCADRYSGNNCEIATANMVWERHYGRSSADEAYYMTKTKDGGCIVVGSTNSNDVNAVGSYETTDVWILKLNESGNIEWGENYGGSGWQSSSAVQQTKDGGYIVAGYTIPNNNDEGQSDGNFDILILKLDNVGNLQWQKTYGGTAMDFVSHIEQTTDGGFIVSATSSSNDGDVEKNNGGEDYWILKLDRSGNMKWSKNYGGENSERTTHIKQTFDDGYIVIGFSSSGSGDVGGNNGAYDYWILKLNNKGDLVWEKNYGGTAYDFATSVIQIEDGSYIVAGYTESNDVDVKANYGNSDCWILKLDGNGDLDWSKNYGGQRADYANSIKQTDNGGYVIAGGTLSDINSELGNFLYDFLVLKLDKFGTLEWKTTFGTKDLDYAYSIEQTKDGTYTVAGWTRFNEGNTDFYVAKLHGN